MWGRIRWQLPVRESQFQGLKDKDISNVFKY